MAAPTFGPAGLSNYGDNQFNLTGFIQPHGALLALREPDYVIVQASANAAEFLDLPCDPIGGAITSLAGDLAKHIGPSLDLPILPTVPLASRCHIGSSHRLFDAVLHRPSHGGLIVEIEHARPPVDKTKQVEEAMGRIVGAYTLQGLCDDTTRIFRDLAGYDRVMVYRFNRQWDGEVLSEDRVNTLEPLLGHRYPATDIPEAARRIYERNRVRTLVDVNATPVPVLPALSPLTGQRLDMSMCALRSASPVHSRHLGDMGVGATLVVSLMVAGKLWGLISCHHHAPRSLSFEMRVMCDLLAEAVATRIAALEGAARGQADHAARRLEQSLAEAIQRRGDWQTALFDSSQLLLQPLNATGAALLFEGRVIATGDVPASRHLWDIGDWLDREMFDQVISTASPGLDAPELEPLRETASSLLATRLSRNPGEYLLWFRPERVRTDTWSSDPEPWTETDLVTAKLIGDTIQDVILQFRSVSVLIAQEQLARVQRQVRVSEIPVVIADADKNILLIDDAFMNLLGAAAAAPTHLYNLAECFKDAATFRRRLRDLCEHGLTWRGEAHTDQNNTPLLVRADPVFSSPGKVSGFVIVFTNLTQQKAAEAARSTFQRHLLERASVATGRSKTNGGRVVNNLLSTVVQNAQLAALEITDGSDAARMPQMLDSVRQSVARTRRALEQLVMHANNGSMQE